jgi:ABC-type transport system involved in multi-copper enzyme maturation permease subunit
MTAPLFDWQVVFSKYLACFAFYVVLWLPTLAYLPVRRLR